MPAAPAATGPFPAPEEEWTFQPEALEGFTPAEAVETPAEEAQEAQEGEVRYSSLIPLSTARDQKDPTRRIETFPDGTVPVFEILP